MSRAAGAVKKVVGKLKKKEAVKVIHPPYITTDIKAGMASAAPPLGPMIGARGLNVQQFCKEFNKATDHIIQGVPIPTRININPDRTFKIEINPPILSWLLFRAAGINRGAMQGTNETAGKITIKHVYEIASVHEENSWNKGESMEKLVKKVMHTAERMGIRVVKELDPQEYKQFLLDRKDTVQEQLIACADLKQAKMTRT